MTVQRVPRVWFLLELPSARGARRELAPMLERHLCARFGPVRSFRLPIWPVQLLLNADGSNFIVAFLQEKRRGKSRGAWLLTINPLDYPVPKKNLPEEKEKQYSKGLMLISNEIETLLTNTPAVLQQGRFFEGWPENTPGVQTPSESPWGPNSSDQ